VSILDVQRDSNHDATIRLLPLPTTTSARADTTTTGKVVPLPPVVDGGSDTGSSGTDTVGTTPTPLRLNRVERASGNTFEALRLSDNRAENEGDDDAAMESTSLDRLVCSRGGRG